MRKTPWIVLAALMGISNFFPLNSVADPGELRDARKAGLERISSFEEIYDNLPKPHLEQYGEDTLNLKKINSKPAEQETILPDLRLIQKGSESGIDASIPLGGDWKLDFDANTTNGDLDKISSAIGYSGEHGVYIGGEYKKFDSDPYLRDADMLKAQIGGMIFDKTFSVILTGAKINIPNMFCWNYSTPYNTPLELYALGWDVNLKGRLEAVVEKGDFERTFVPWVSMSGSGYFPKLKDTGGIEKIRKINERYAKYSFVNDNSFAFPFSHIKAGLGADILTKYFDPGLEFVYGGNFNPDIGSFYITPKIAFHNGENKINYEFEMNFIPNHFGPILANFKSNISTFLMSPFGLYFKGDFNINHSQLNDINFIMALGYALKDGNFEVFYNNKDDILGLSFSTQLDRDINTEDYTIKKFHKISKPASPDIYGTWIKDAGDSSLIHSVWGEGIDDAVEKIHSEEDLSLYLSYFKWDEEDYTEDAEEIHDSGKGICQNLNGILAPEIARKAFGYECWGRGIRGPYMGHVVMVIKKKNGKYDLRDYWNYYEFNADSEEEAIEMFYPGVSMYGGGKRSPTAKKVIEAVERGLFKWREMLK